MRLVSPLALSSVFLAVHVSATPARAVPAVSDGAAPSATSSFRAELLEPGKTLSAQLKELLGKPYRRVPDGRNRDFYFYGLGQGSTMDATVSVRGGVVEYVSYLCSDSLKDVQRRYASEPSITRTLESAQPGYSGSLVQVLFEGKGRGYVYEPRTHKVRACVAWAPGKKFDELGR